MTFAELAGSRAAQRTRRLAQALADGELWLVGPLLGMGLMIPRLLAPALVLAAGFWVVRWLAWGCLTMPTVADIAVVALMLMIPVTLWVTALPDVTRQQVLWLLTGIALYYAVVNWMVTAERERGLVLCLVGCGLFTALLAPVAVVWVTDKLTFIPATVYRGLPLLTSMPAHPNVLAGALVLGLPLPLALLLFDGPQLKRHERWAAGAAALGIAAILVLTRSRGALLAAAVAGLTLALLRWRRARWFIVTGALAGALVTGLALGRVGLAEVVDRLMANGSIIGGPGRLEIWTRGVYLVQDFPYTGIGMGTFQEVTNALYPFFLLGPDADVPHAHNIFIQVAVDLGIPGLAAWLGLLLLSAFAAWRVYQWGRGHGQPWAAGVGAGLVCSQIALAVHGVLDAAVWGAHSAMVVWVLWGVCVASYNLRYNS